MTYTVKEIFYTLQGEGRNSGAPAIFCRFSGCNLWNGQERDRANAICKFCDTDFVGSNAEDGGKFLNAILLADKIEALWPNGSGDELYRLVVLTGGEPLLQVDDTLIEELHHRKFLIAVESNGTIIPPKGIDWLCISPKIGSELKVHQGQELKLVYPQIGGDPSQFEHLAFEYFYLQPLDDVNQKKNTQWAINYCQAHPRWKLSVQVHKALGIR